MVELQADLAREFPDKVEFVRADHYFNLHYQAHGQPFNLAMAPTTLLKGGAASTSPERAIDGTPTTLWTSSEAGQQWLEFDFGAVHKISRLVIRHAGAFGMSRDYNTRNFMVQARANGGSWTTIEEVKGNTADVTDVEFDPVGARFIKITVSDPGADSTARIAEVEIYGKSIR
jgi:hypothetical protein